MNIITFGVESSRNKHLPDKTVRLLEDWGLKNYDLYPSSIRDIKFNERDSIVLSLDSFVRNRLEDLGIQSINLQENPISNEFKHLDPKNLEYKEFKLEIAKAAVVTTNWISQHLEIQGTNISSNVFRTINSLKYYINNLSDETSAFVDTNICDPITNPTIYNERTVINFNPRHLKFEPNPQIKSPYFVSKFECNFLGRLFLSREWREFITKISTFYNVNLLVYPRNIGFDLSADELISTINSTKITYHY